MKNWFLHILLLAGLFGMLTTSCSQDEALEEVVETRNEKLQVSFTLNLGEGGMESRTTWEGYDKNDANAEGETGNNIENKVEDIQVLLFSNDDNTFLGEVSISAFYPTEGDSHLYKFYGELPTLPTDKSIMDTNKYLNCKIMVLANCSVDPSQISGTTTINTLLEAATFNFNGNPSLIPMWGVLKVIPTDQILMKENGFPNPLPDIYLLRAMAKVEVIMKAEDHEISSIAINRYNNTGYCVPTGYGTTTDTKALVRNSAFRSTNRVNSGQQSFFNNVSTVTENGNTYKCYTIYVPEYDNLSNGVTPSTITVQLDGKSKSYTIKHGTNGKNTEYNIVRNHIYRYNITKVNDGAELELTLVVNPWDVIEENIQFTDEVTVKQKMQWSGTYKPNTDDASILYIDNAINDATAATVTFQIDTPVGATWYASFEGDKDSFAFLDEDGNELTSVTGNVGEPATLKIVTKEKHVGEMKSVSLMIVVRTMDGRTIMVNKDLMPEALKDKDYFQLRQNLSI